MRSTAAANHSGVVERNAAIASMAATIRRSPTVAGSRFPNLSASAPVSGATGRIASGTAIITRPATDAGYPIRSCSAKGIRNMFEASAMKVSHAASSPAESLQEPRRRGSTSGALCPHSTSTNSSPAASASTRRSKLVSPRSGRARRVRARSSSVVAPKTSPAPTRSSLPWLRVPVLGRAFQPHQRAPAASGSGIRKIARQPAVVTSRPPREGPAIRPAATAACIQPSARPRLLSG